MFSLNANEFTTPEKYAHLLFIFQSLDAHIATIYHLDIDDSNRIIEFAFFVAVVRLFDFEVFSSPAKNVERKVSEDKLMGIV